MRFNFYQSMKFQDNEKAMCMRVDNSIPLVDEFLYELVHDDLLERCVTWSLLIIEFVGS